MKKRVLLIGVIVLILAAIIFRLASNKKTIEAKKTPAVTEAVAIPVNVEVVAEGPVESALVKTGTLIPYKEADIMAVSAGKLTAVNFELGSRLGSGAVVATVDNRSLQLQLEAASLAQQKSEKDFKRYQALLEGEATTEVTFQDAKLNAENALNQMEQIRKQIADNRIKAPISGQVVSKMVESGEFVSPGTVLGHMVDVSRLKVQVRVAEQDVYQLKTGQEVQIRTDIYPGKVFKGKVSFISSKGDATHNYPVEIEMHNPGDTPLKAGTFAYVDFSRESSEHALIIPRTALVASIKNPYVYVVKDGKALVRKIQVGREVGSGIVVLDGLDAGETIVTSGQINLSDGASVSPVTTAGPQTPAAL